jgi:prevent-host-death family protein
MAAHRKSTPTKVPATDVHRNFGDLVRRTYSGQEHFIVERDGLPVVAIISMAEYEELMQERERREERLRKFEQSARAIGEEIERQGLTEEEVMAKLEEAKEEVYQAYYGDKSTS